jgi:hypothetical protein
MWTARDLATIRDVIYPIRLPPHPSHYFVDNSRFQSKSLWVEYSQNFQTQPHIVLVPSYKKRSGTEPWVISTKEARTQPGRVRLDRLTPVQRKMFSPQ